MVVYPAATRIYISPKQHTLEVALLFLIENRDQQQPIEFLVSAIFSPLIAEFVDSSAQSCASDQLVLVHRPDHVPICPGAQVRPDRLHIYKIQIIK
jgi:hypothetical protein